MSALSDSIDAIADFLIEIRDASRDETDQMLYSLTDYITECLPCAAHYGDAADNIVEYDADFISELITDKKTDSEIAKIYIAECERNDVYLKLDETIDAIKNLRDELQND